MTTTSLADIRAAAEKKYGDYPVDLGEGRVVVMRHALRLGETNREQLLTLIDSVQSQKGDDDGGIDAHNIGPLVESIRQVVRLVADREELAEELITTIGDDLPMLIELLEGYMQVAQVGEASPSDA